MTQASWKNRRRMAWASFAIVVGFLLGVSYRLFYCGDDPTAWTGILTILLGGLIGIVIGYAGFATMADIKEKNK